MLGYVQKDRAKASFCFFTNMDDRLLEEAAQARSDNTFSAEQGKVILTRVNVYKEAYKFWRINFEPTQISLSETVMMMLQTQMYCFSGSLTFGQKISPDAADALWALYLNPDNSDFVSKRTVERVLFQGRPDARVFFKLTMTNHT
jgi:hypothetical protein